jgi:hypothetical protein
MIEYVQASWLEPTATAIIKILKEKGYKDAIKSINREVTPIWECHNYQSFGRSTEFITSRWWILAIDSNIHQILSEIDAMYYFSRYCENMEYEDFLRKMLPQHESK